MLRPRSRLRINGTDMGRAGQSIITRHNLVTFGLNKRWAIYELQLATFCVAFLFLQLFVQNNFVSNFSLRLNFKDKKTVSFKVFVQIFLILSINQGNTTKVIILLALFVSKKIYWSFLSLCLCS